MSAHQRIDPVGIVFGPISVTRWMPCSSPLSVDSAIAARARRGVEGTAVPADDSDSVAYVVRDNKTVRKMFPILAVYPIAPLTPGAASRAAPRAVSSATARGSGAHAGAAATAGASDGAAAAGAAGSLSVAPRRCGIACVMVQRSGSGFCFGLESGLAGSGSGLGLSCGLGFGGLGLGLGRR